MPTQPRQLVKAEEALSRALGLELLAAFAPTCWMLLIDMLQAGTAVAAAAVRAPPKRKVNTPAPVETTTAQPAPADVIDRWVTLNLEAHPTEFLTPKQLAPTSTSTATSAKSRTRRRQKCGPKWVGVSSTTTRTIGQNTTVSGCA